MSAFTLPLRTDDVAHYEFSTDLDGRVYVFEFRWNHRDGAWYMAIRTEQGEPLISRKVVVGFPLTSRSRDVRLFPGEIIAVDTSGEKSDPGLGELGNRVQILYFERSDLPAELVE